jgi:hypothetical protein
LKNPWHCFSAHASVHSCGLGVAAGAQRCQNHKNQMI